MIWMALALALIPSSLVCRKTIRQAYCIATVYECVSVWKGTHRALLSDWRAHGPHARMMFMRHRHELYGNKH